MIMYEMWPYDKLFLIAFYFVMHHQTQFHPKIRSIETIEFYACRQLMAYYWVYRTVAAMNSGYIMPSWINYCQYIVHMQLDNYLHMIGH